MCGPPFYLGGSCDSFFAGRVGFADEDDCQRVDDELCDGVGCVAWDY